MRDETQNEDKFSQSQQSTNYQLPMPQSALRRKNCKSKGANMTLQLHAWEQTLLLRAKEVYQALPAIVVQDNALLKRAYDYCESVTATHSRSFYTASSLLPYDKQRAVRALYAFCRKTDDIVDAPTGDIETELSLWRKKVLGGDFSAEDPIALAWADTRTRYHIPARFITQLIDGVARDLEQTRYQTFADLATYAYGVASTVGLMSMHIIGFDDPDSTYYAIKLGVALQLTNILRDVGQDWRMGRVYLPQDELAAFGIDDSYFEQGKVDERWRTFMRYQIDRNRRLYHEAQPGISMLHQDGRFSIAAAAELYQAILVSIERNQYDVFNHRAFVTKWGKLRLLPALWWQTR